MKLTLQEARKIEKAKPGIKFTVMGCSNGMGFSFAADIKALEHLFKNFTYQKDIPPSGRKNYFTVLNITQ